ncbi:sulfatase [Acanthopleuribacter pedis]|uniref:Sulfatase n=1 Tax=Acanthopleuribacter pedis TaxID=442870 RepID=A0A8J7Q231_9BACT|nr:sulfatase [Acanthopleuribacter pedis]MBO1319072.1 sulfatase [Acanthopleuribacter pedis]
MLFPVSASNPHSFNAFFRAVFSACLLLFAMVGCQQQPGYTVSQVDGLSKRAGFTVLPARVAEKTFTLPVEAGRQAWLLVGNGSEEARTVSVTGAQPASVTLPPKQWQVVALQTERASLQMDWPAGELYFGDLYVLPEQAKDAHNILLISVDTLRADRFEAATMPGLTAFYEKGLRFERAYTTAPWTLPAHASMLTGYTPARHGVREPEQYLSRETTTLAERLQLQGYFTVGLTEGNYMAEVFGLAQGFHLYYEDPPFMMEQDPSRASRFQANLDRLDAVLAEHEDKAPMFVFLHTYEVHCPYLPHDGLSDPDNLGGTRWLLDNEFGDLTDEHLAHLIKLYDGEVAYTDRLLTPLVERLAAKGNWTIILTSDHGEEFGEHGGLLHADTLYEEVTRVPLALIGRGVTEKGRTNDPVSIVDIAPTILNLVGAPADEQSEGRDLLALPRATTRSLFAESYFFGPHVPAEDPRLTAVWKAHDKLIQKRNHGQFTAELYALNADPAEQKNLSEEDIKKRDALFLFLQDYLAGKAFKAGRLESLSEEQLEVMRSLGYTE